MALLQFSLDKDYYENQAEKYYEQGKTVDAIDCIYRAIELTETDDKDLYYFLAQCYSSLDVMDMASKAYQKAYSIDFILPEEDIFVDLIRCIGFTHGLDAARKYLDLAMQDGLIEEQTLDELDELMVFEQMRIEKEQAESNTAAVRTSFYRVQSSLRLMQEGKLDEAMSTLDEIDYRDAEYAEAQKVRCMIYSYGGDHEKAASLANEILRATPDDLVTLCILYKENFELGNRDAQQRAAKRLLDACDFSKEQAMQVLAVFITARDYVNEIACYDKILATPACSYDRGTLILKAIAQHNLGAHVAAKETITLTRRLYPHSVDAHYYAKIIYKCGEEEITPSPTMEDSERERIASELFETVSNATVYSLIDNICTDDEFKDRLLWLACEHGNENAAKMIGILSNLPQTQHLARHVLLTDDCPLAVKWQVLFAALDGNEISNLALSQSGVVNRVKNVRFKSEIDGMDSAFCSATATLLILDERPFIHKKMRAAFNEIQTKLVERGVKQLTPDQRHAVAYVAFSAVKLSRNVEKMHRVVVYALYEQYADEADKIANELGLSQAHAAAKKAFADYASEYATANIAEQINNIINNENNDTDVRRADEEREDND